MNSKRILMVLLLALSLLTSACQGRQPTEPPIEATLTDLSEISTQVESTPPLSPTTAPSATPTNPIPTSTGEQAFAAPNATPTSPAAPALLAQPSDTPPPSPTALPTQAPNPTASIAAYDFKELAAGSSFFIFPPFFLGTVDAGPCLESNLVERVSGSDLPVMFVADAQVEYGGRASMCIYGFPLNSMIRVDIYTPEGKLVDTLDLEVQIEDNGLTVLHLPFVLPLYLPHGDWRVIASQGDTSIRRKFEHPLSSGMMITHAPARTHDSLSPADQRRINPYRPGQTMSIEGINFPAGMDLPVGIYSKQGSQYIPLKGQVVRTDNHGAFEHAHRPGRAGARHIFDHPDFESRASRRL